MYWVKLLISCIIYIIKALPVWIIPMITANVITIVTEQKDDAIQKIILNMVILVAVALQNIPTHALYCRYVDRILRTVGMGLRSTIIRKLQHLSITYHKEMESGRIQSKFLRDVESIEQLNSRLLKMLFQV